MFRLEVSRALRDEGYDVLRASETGHARADDSEILKKAINDNRVLITLDDHFGDWVILPLSLHPGVVRIKINPTTSGKIIGLLLPFLKQTTSDQLKDHLVILSEKRAKWIFTGK